MTKAVSFDFDGTLTAIEWSDEKQTWINSANPNPKMVRLIKKLHARGYEVHSVTRRSSAMERPETSYGEPSIFDFLEAHGLTKYVTKVHFCGDEDASGNKIEILGRIGSTRHYDDLQEHVDQANIAGVRGRKVPRPGGSE